MTRHTARDGVTGAVIKILAERKRQESPTGATVADVMGETEASRRTVLDVLKTYVEQGLLTERTRRGETPNGQRDRTEYFAAGALAPIGCGAPTTGEGGDEVHETTTENTDAEVSEGSEMCISDTAEQEAVEPGDGLGDIEARYVIGCPKCDRQQTRQKDSSFVKGVRRSRYFCEECNNSPLELLKDDRPDPPMCPECGEEIIEIKERSDHLEYVHDYTVEHIGGSGSKRVDSCHVPSDEV